MDGQVSIGFIARLWHRLFGWFRAERRAMTIVEYGQAEQLHQKDQEIARLQTQVRELKTEIEIHLATIRIREHEMQLLADVTARDRARIQAEESVAKAHQLAAVAPRVQGGGM